MTIPSAAEIPALIMANRVYFRPWSKIAFRTAEEDWSSNQKILTGVGAAANGGRWNPKRLRATYLSLDPETTVAEALAYARYFNLPLEDVMPIRTKAVTVNLQKLLDLTDPVIAARFLGLVPAMVNEDFHAVLKAGGVPLSQAFGGYAAKAGCEGLLIPSRTNLGHSNLVVYPAKLVRTSYMRIYKKEKNTP